MIPSTPLFSKITVLSKIVTAGCSMAAWLVMIALLRLRKKFMLYADAT